MSKTLARMAVAALVFIHFRDPATDQPMYVQKDVEKDGVTQTVDDLAKPIGVRAYTPGSTYYRNAEATNATASFRAGKKGLTGEGMYNQQTELLAKTVKEYVNFEYDDAGASYENNKKLFADLEFVAIREQVHADQADLGKCSKAPAKA